MSFRKDLRSGPTSKKNAATANPVPAVPKTTGARVFPQSGGSTPRPEVPQIPLTPINVDHEPEERVEEALGRRRKPAALPHDDGKRQRVGDSSESGELESPKSKLMREARDSLNTAQWATILKKTPMEAALSLPHQLARAAATAQVASEFLSSSASAAAELGVLRKRLAAEEHARQIAEARVASLVVENEGLLKERDEAVAAKEKAEFEWSRIDTDLEAEREKCKLKVAKVLSNLDEANRKLAAEEQSRQTVEAQVAAARAEGREEGLKEGKEVGFDEGADDLLFTTWLHYPNSRCPQFSFYPYGTARAESVNYYQRDGDCVKERTEVQLLYTNPPTDFNPFANPSPSVPADPPSHEEPLPNFVNEEPPVLNDTLAEDTIPQSTVDQS